MTETAAPTSLKRAQQRYKKKDRETIAAYHRVDPANPVVDVLLSFCVEYDLDPLGGHVWLTDESFERTVAKDGDPESKLRDADAELKVGITRDGLLAIANRTPGYEGMEHDTVRAKDVFKATRDGGDVKIFHEYPDLPGEDDATKLDGYRGDVLGAYCKTFISGRKPTYYFAFLSEHGVFDEAANGDRDFYGAWRYLSTMILKAAQSYTLRIALGVTGVVGLDEIKRGDRTESVATAPPTPMEDPSDYIGGLDLSEELRLELAEKVEEVNGIQANSWSLAKLKMRLEAADEDGARAVLEEVSREIEQRQENAPAAAPVA